MVNLMLSLILAFDHKLWFVLLGALSPYFWLDLSYKTRLGSIVHIQLPIHVLKFILCPERLFLTPKTAQLPQEHIKWLIQQPDEALSIWKVRVVRNGIKYQSITVDHKSTIAFTERIIGRCLTWYVHLGIVPS